MKTAWGTPALPASLSFFLSLAIEAITHGLTGGRVVGDLVVESGCEHRGMLFGEVG